MKALTDAIIIRSFIMVRLISATLVLMLISTMFEKKSQAKADKTNLVMYYIITLI